jgi:nucleoside-diphosphate-sugar epimerase
VKRVLITGVTGAIGVEVAARLQARYQVTGLVHSVHDPVRNSGKALRGPVSLVEGDVTRPLLGLERSRHDGLRASTDLVVHCAAVTDFGRAPDVYDRVNVAGTANVLDFAGGSGAAIPLVHVSTAYVCGERDGRIRERELNAGQSFANPYEHSKFRAEQLVRAATHVPSAIVRPSIVVGDERTGRVRDFKNLYVVLKLATQGRVTSIPAAYDARIDIVAIDHVVRVIAACVERFEEAAGQTFHAVGATPLTLRDFSDVLAEYPSFSVPRFMPAYSFDCERLPALERAYYQRVVRLYESYFRRRAIFDDMWARAFAGASRVRADTLLRRVLDHCVQVGYLGVPSVGPAEALTTAGAMRAVA